MKPHPDNGPFPPKLPEHLKEATRALRCEMPWCGHKCVLRIDHSGEHACICGERSDEVSA